MRHLLPCWPALTEHWHAGPPTAKQHYPPIRFALRAHPSHFVMPDLIGHLLVGPSRSLGHWRPRLSVANAVLPAMQSPRTLSFTVSFPCHFELPPLVIPSEVEKSPAPVLPECSQSAIFLQTGSRNHGKSLLSCNIFADWEHLAMDDPRRQRAGRTWPFS